MHNCLNCNLLIPLKRKFCGSSCSATYNNLKRGRNYTRIKSTTIGKRGFFSKRHVCGPNSKVYFRQCSVCQKYFASQKKIGTTCSDQCFIAVKRKNASGIKRQIYKNFIFDSGWEVKMAQLLDEANIIWEQPKTSIPWIDKNGKEHKYFPDFYLPNLNIFLDPKNPIVVIKQQEKLDQVKKSIKLLYGEPNRIMEMLTGVEPA
jgi:predicted nucleic acid-binding Zn ribbon protein